MSFEQRYLTAPEVATLLRTSTTVVYQWAREHRFTSGIVIRIGKKLLFDRVALEAWARDGGSVAAHSERRAA